MAEKVTKTKVLELATLQSQSALGVTSNLRAHGWRTHWENGASVLSDDDYRRRQAQRALAAARDVERNARATQTWVEAWAKQEGAS